MHGVMSIAEPVTAHWSGYLLLVIYAVSQISSTYFMSATMDKTQRRLMMVLPVFFIFFLLNFPVGLVIYWVTTNLWTVGQGLVTRRLVPKTPPAPPSGPKRSSRTPSPSSDDGGSGNGAQTAPEPKTAPEPAPEPKPRQPSTQPRRVKRNKGHGRR